MANFNTTFDPIKLGGKLTPTPAGGFTNISSSVNNTFDPIKLGGKLMPKTPAPTPAPKQTLGGTILGGAKAVGNFLTTSEQGLGQDIAGGLSAVLPKSWTGVAQTEKANQQASDADLHYVQTLIKGRNDALAQGKDTTHYDTQLKNFKSSTGATIADLYPALKKSGFELAGDIGGTALDILTSGTYGAAKTATMKTGELATKEAPSIIEKAGKAGLDIAKKTEPYLKKGFSELSGVTKKVVLGKDAIETLKQLGDTEAQKFAKGGKTFSEVVDKAQKGIEIFISKSKEALQVVKQKIPKIAVDTGKIAEAVNKGIMDSIRGTQNYKGIEGEAETLFKKPEDLINSGVLNADEAKKVQGMVDAVKGWKDTTARGVLNLKEQLSSFYKDGLDGSNRILSNIQKNMKNIVAEVYPEIKPALEKASANIDKAENFTRNLVGKTAQTGESKLLSITRKLTNPALGEENLSLIKDLKNATGIDLMPELKGFNNFEKLLKGAGGNVENIGSKVGTIAKAAGKRLGIAGGITAAGAEVKNLLGL